MRHLALWLQDVQIAHLAVHAWALLNRRSSTSPTGRARFVVTYDRQRDETNRLNSD